MKISTKISLTVLTVVILVTAVGCGIVPPSEVDEYFNRKDDFGMFVEKVYNAKGKNDVEIGVKAIEKHLTKEAYTELLSEIGSYKEVDSHLEDLQVHYVQSKNTSKSLTDKLYVTFRVVNGDRSQLNSIEFISNTDGLYDRYNIYQGIMEQREGI